MRTIIINDLLLAVNNNNWETQKYLDILKTNDVNGKLERELLIDIISDTSSLMDSLVTLALVMLANPNSKYPSSTTSDVTKKPIKRPDLTVEEEYAKDEEIGKAIFD